MRLNSSWQNVALLAALLLTLSVAGKTPAQQRSAPGTVQTAVKVERLLKETGLNNKKYGEGIWLVEAQGKNFPVLVAASGDVVVVGVIVVKKGTIAMSQEFLYKVAKLNHEYDFVKIGLDNEDDLFARSERKVAGLTAADFKETFDQVVNATDKVVEQLRGLVK